MRRVLYGILTVLALFVAISITYTEGFELYPGAKLDKQLTKESARQAAQAKLDTKPSIYVTGDSFDKVFAFYRGGGKEYKMPYAGPGKAQRLPSGKELKIAFLSSTGQMTWPARNCGPKSSGHLSAQE
ncbi:hypothetical protein [uncultured Desulfosarcina sp.]|uniref:hypothetical protein n=1 Tax=uncultured Desulfosarcina sp. TaxID=218289 RepID=UPI0029C73BA9|nr:hypothetical protein [uncultured Desulfosarcina sp.]